MASDENLERALNAALEADTRVNLHRNAIRLEVRSGRAQLNGEAVEMRAKRAATAIVSGFPGILAFEDHIRVRPAEVMGDGAIRDRLRDILTSEPVFARHDIRIAHNDGSLEVVREIADCQGAITFNVREGRVRLEGDVFSLSHCRLAEVLAWWIPGTTEVENRLSEPDRIDNDGEVADAVKLVLEKDRWVDASRITVRAENFCVILAGNVPSREQRDAAEHDVWYVDGVRDVSNELIAP